MIVAVKKCSISINKLHYIDLLTGQRKQQAAKQRKNLFYYTRNEWFCFHFHSGVIVIVPLSGFEVWKSLACNWNQNTPAHCIKCNSIWFVSLAAKINCFSFEILLFFAAAHGFPPLDHSGRFINFSCNLTLTLTHPHLICESSHTKLTRCGEIMIKVH